jgi:hypothetical protein
VYKRQVYITAILDLKEEISTQKHKKIICSDVTDGYFFVQGSKTKFCWLVILQREPLVSEVNKKDSKIFGNGEYKYLKKIILDK